LPYHSQLLKNISLKCLKRIWFLAQLLSLNPFVRKSHAGLPKATHLACHLLKNQLLGNKSIDANMRENENFYQINNLARINK